MDINNMDRTNRSKLETEIIEYLSENNYELYHLAKLQKWLNKELIDSRYDDLIVLAAPLALPFVLLSIILFTPLMVRSLHALKRKGWLLTLFIMVTLPLLIVFMTDIFAAKVLFIGISVISYFLFCGILKVEVDEWYKNMKAARIRKLQKDNPANRQPEDWIVMR